MTAISPLTRYRALRDVLAEQLAADDPEVLLHVLTRTPAVLLPSAVALRIDVGQTDAHG